jgi:hypothetical protein
MKRLIAVVSILANFAVPAFGQFSDSFSSSAVTSANWGTAVLTQVGPNMGTTTSVLFGQDDGNGRVDFSAIVNGNSGTNRLMSLQSYVGSVSADWTVSVSVTNNFSTATAGQIAQVGLFVSNTDGLSWGGPPTHDYVKLVLSQNSTLGAYIHGGLHLDGSPSPLDPPNNPKSVDIAPTSGLLQLSYLASTQVITASYNFGSGLTTFGTYGVAGSGGSTANTTWDTSTFTVSLYGQAEAGATGFTLATGTAFLDDFSSTGLTVAAVPEPATYAALAGLAALSLAFWHRRRRA